MKQTSNAIKFLMAQYRAIFKSAYFKGLATAAVVTAGLAAGAAQATDYTIDNINDRAVNPSSRVTIGSGDKFSLVGDGSHGASSDAPFVIDRDIIIDNKATGSNSIIGSGSDFFTRGQGLTIRSGSDFFFGNSTNTQNKRTTSEFTDITIDAGATLFVMGGAGATKNDATVTVTADVVNIKGTVNLNQSSGSSGSNAILRGDIINVSGKDAVVNIGKASDPGNGSSRGVLGWRATLTNGVFDDDGSKITVTNGATINLNGTADAGEPRGHHAQIWGQSLEMSDSNLVVSGSSGGGILQLQSVALNNNDIVINDESTLSLQLRAGNQNNASAGNSLYDQTNGTATISGGTVVIDGTLRMTTGGTLTIAEGTNLTAGSANPTATQKRDNAIFIGAINPSTNQGIAQSFEGSTLPTLNIASSTLDSFLNKADEELVDLDGKPVADYRGQLNLTFGAHVNFTDDTTVEMTDFTFANKVGAGNIVLDDKYTQDSGIGKIGVDDDTGGKKNGNIEIFAKNMSVASSMLADTASGNVDKMSENSSLGIDFKANVLTLGSNDRVENGHTVYGYDSSATYGLGARSFTAFDQVHIIDGKGDTYHLKDDLVLTRDYYTKDAEGNYTSELNTVGTIHGDSISIEGGKTMTVSGGAWSNVDNQTLELVDGNTSTGALVVTAIKGNETTTKGSDSEGDWQAYLNGNPSSLTWNGSFIFNGHDSSHNNSDKARVVVTGARGADATLDLTKANIDWGHGQVLLSGAISDGEANHTSTTDFNARGGFGIMKITGAQLADFLNVSANDDTPSTGTHMNISGGGMLLVDGAVTGEINFNKFVSSGSQVAGGGLVNFVSGTGSEKAYLVSTGELSLVTGVDLNGNGTIETDSEAKDLDLGANGVIVAQGITLNNKNVNDETAPEENKVTVDAGTLVVAERLSTSNNIVEFGSGAGLVLETDWGYGVTNTAGSGVVNAAQLNFTSGSEFEVVEGSWTVSSTSGLGDINLTSSSLSLSSDDTRGSSASALTADNLYVATANTTNDDIELQANSSLTLNTLQVADGTNISVGRSATLTLVGRNDIDDSTDSTELQSVQDAKETAGISFGTGSTVEVNGGKFVLGDTAASALVQFGVTPSGSSTVDHVVVNEAIANARIDLNNGAEMRLDFSSGSAANINGGIGLTADQARELKSELVDSIGRGSYINVGQLALNIEYTDKANLITTWDKVKDFVKVESDVANDDLKKTLVTGITSSDEISGHFGAVRADLVGQNYIRVDGPLGLHHAHKGYFAATGSEDNLQAIGLNLSSYSTLELQGAGKVGAITGNGGSSTESSVRITASETQPGVTEVLGQISGINDLTVENETQVSGLIDTNYAFINNVLNNTGYDSTYSEVNVGANGNLTTDNLTITGTGNITSTGISMVNGKVTVAEALTLGTATSSATFAVAGGTVEANSLVLNNGSVVQVGWEGAESDDADTTWIDESKSYSGRMLVQTADLNGGSIVSDPENGLQTAIMGINKFAGASTTNSTDLGSVDGSLYVGRNSVQALGADDWAEIESAIAPYATNGVLTSYGAMMYLDGTTSLTSGDGIVMTAQSIKDFTTYIANETKLGALDADSHTLANTVYFGANTALLVTADAMDAAATDRGNTALVTFADGNGQLVADGGEILVAGDVRATNYTLFTDTDGKVAVVDNQGALTTAENGITVTTENGFLVGTLSGENGGNVTLTVSRDGRSVMSGASDPVYTTLVAYAKGYNGVETTDEATGTKSADYLTNGYVTNADGTVVTDDNGNPVKNRTYSNELLQNVISTGNGRDAETVARLGMLGGVAQSAMAAGASTYDAIAGRMGVGSSMGNVTIANNTQGASLWLTPIYKNSESDGFEADNLDYGVDIDLYGVALGADFTMQNGVRVGAMFNVGSGDADGNGAGSAVSNDFDYYGFGVYAGYTYGAFSVLADVTYTVADNDVEGSTSLGQVSTSLDSTNLSVGVTGQYNLNLGGVDVTPHAGLRFSSIDIDDYDVADIASYDADSLNIFSIPVGVTFAKEFQGEAWTWKPSLDITVQGNFGDDSADGTVAWAGIDNLKTELSSEVIDNFTYGATLGVAAQTGNFSMGLGINYTGSSNVDDYGVSANARFVF